MTDGSFIFAGGMGLAAYHAGAYEAFAASGGILKSVAGSSAGAVTAALIAGNSHTERLHTLRRYWRSSSDHPPTARTYTQGWLNAIQARLLGRSGQFNPRPALENFVRFQSVYDLRPLRERLIRLIDFERLNSGDPRICIATTDILTGEPVIFDTAAGHQIQVDHILASCGYIPEFPAVTIDGKLLGDGGLSMNAPFEPLLDSESSEPLFIVDLYARDGAEPESLAASVERRNDLIFANQTYLRLQANLRYSSHAGRKIYLLNYRSRASEPGPEKLFDLSVSAIQERWWAGRMDMQLALAPIENGGSNPIVIRQPT
jgi:NTE family protein